MFYNSKNNVINNYTFNHLKNIAFLKYIENNQLECKVCKEILEFIKDNPKQYQTFLKCLMYKEIKELTDELTYLFNKKFYSKFIAPFSIKRKSDWNNIDTFWNVFQNRKKAYYVLIDIGNFKKINDIFSYKTGDYFLKLFSYFLIKENPDFAIRNGGDEFVLIYTSKEKVDSLLKKFKDISFIKNLNYNIYKMYLMLNKTKNEKTFFITNNHSIVYIGTGTYEIKLNKIKKYIHTKNSKAYHQYINKIETEATENMKKNKQKIKKNINIISYRN